ncbi:alcohol dehydrogenase catalytic domain-containing protein [Sphingomonas sp.]|uniref:alcohol dehydrogenase catalytic domain-containing protein n=1 Tax=Sphingomonas sp. TaxID=28214 RepID=UPI0025E47225|nr:alcohol dehydrogenase catalytic domain-containing protein [Sphingomonas sp.]
MRQLTLTDIGSVAWVEVAEPVLTGDGAAIVRPVAVAVCDFDRGLVSGRYTALPYPIALGHEMVAEVVEVGSQVRTIAPGMQIVLPLHIFCGACASCGSGLTNSCLSRPPLSNYGLGSRGGDWGGGMSDLLAVPYADAMAVPLPPGLDKVACAAVGCNMVDLYRTIAPYLAGRPDAEVLIVGGHAHNMALYGVAVARALGVSSVSFMDDHPERLAAAEQLGARPVQLGDRSRLYPIVVDCSGDTERVALALSLVGPDGVCTPVWPYVGSADLPIGAMFLRNATLVTGQPHARALMEPVLDLMQRTGLSSLFIPVEVLRWGEAPEKFGAGEVKRIFVRD